ncbi:hypothetical protein V5T82_15325 [Magnetovibrio sp. PR-2]|uniref:hypothetical protein n=1 Tax=Magnetovibrio sp. PR-2 TaxID=3120356 RepID=UPI002FCE07D6
MTHQQVFLSKISEAVSGPITTDQYLGLAIFAIVIAGFIIGGLWSNYSTDKNSPWDSY